MLTADMMEQRAWCATHGTTSVRCGAIVDARGERKRLREQGVTAEESSDAAELEAASELDTGEDILLDMDAIKNGSLAPVEPVGSCYVVSFLHSAVVCARA